MSQPFEIGDKVLVKDTNQHGVVSDIKSFNSLVHQNFTDDHPMYFVRVPEWDNGMNGGRWIGAGGLVSEANHEK